MSSDILDKILSKHATTPEEFSEEIMKSFWVYPDDVLIDILRTATSILGYRIIGQSPDTVENADQWQAAMRDIAQAHKDSITSFTNQDMSGQCS